MRLTEAFNEIDSQIDEMLDEISEAIDLLEKDKKEEAMEILVDLEENLLDFLGYEECECEEEEKEEEAEEEEEKPAKKSKSKAKR